ncbi:hypothetical protein B0T24DRAFT_709914 [Lasiosphaeria ovina]|uniref:DUF4470 domain-containing protein n=1 Tax=Lasiosphaeria ovina TaxID=92902 RepID=A0AAE0K051_9PEZI|nr:hypothetical protein B0T24DRAFT_709914 [Lasiosphaeria ovina]
MSTPRQYGKVLHGEGKLPEAQAAYRLAATVTPLSPGSLSFFSDVKFDMGEYLEASNLAAEAAVRLGPPMPGLSMTKEKLYAQQARAHLFANNFVGARLAADKMANGDARSTLLADLKNLGVASDKVTVDRPVLREKAIENLPHYRPKMHDEPKYFAVGDEIVRSSLFNNHLFSSNDDLSFLYCGISDSRNMFAAIIRASEALEKKDGSFETLHITAVDIKAASLAKLLIIFELISDYNKAASTDLTNDEDLCFYSTAMAYVHAGHVYPAFVHDTLQAVISRLIKSLAKDDKLSSCVYVAPGSHRAIILQLEQWYHASRNSHYSLARVKTRFRSPGGVYESRGLEDLSVPRSLNADLAFFQSCLIVPPPKQLTARYEPRIEPLLKACRENRLAAHSMLNAYVDRAWKTNVTLIDAKYEARRRRANHAEQHDHLPLDRPEYNATASVDDYLAMDVDLDPFQVAGRVIPWVMPSLWTEGSLSLIDRLGDFFACLADSFAEITDSANFVIELVQGEMASVMEKLQFRCFESRPPQFPHDYDRIDLSSIPDVTGGLFVPLVYARPLLKPRVALEGATALTRPSSVRFSNQLSFSWFRTHEDFKIDSVLLSSSSLVGSHFQLRHEPWQTVLYSSKQNQLPGFDDYRAGYNVWVAIEPPLAMAFDQLQPRAELEKWVLSFFLKLCLPVRRASNLPAPLNLTAFPRLLARIHGAGYPAHWLSDILADLVIVTTARPPTNTFTGTNELRRGTMAKNMCVAPFVAELTTLLSIWRPLLPFNFATRTPGAVPPLTGISQCRLDFPEDCFSASSFEQHDLVLVFFNTARASLPGGYNGELRERVLLESIGDDTGDDARDREATALRETWVHVISAFCWKAALWRADDWNRQTEGVWAMDTLEIEHNSWLDLC